MVNPVSPSVVCTLFEGDYHDGVAVLVNSLHAHGYRGTIWAGYRGSLPTWAAPVSPRGEFFEFHFGEGCTVCFMPIGTAGHLTNFKPDFMRWVLREADPQSTALFYFDPDIVLCEAWSFFEEWVTCGLAVCEDVNSPFALHHPRRVGWRRFFDRHSIELQPRRSEYANGGFLGLERENFSFLELWQRMQDLVWLELGGSHFAGIAGGEPVHGRSGFADCFGMTDQDALNAALEATAQPVSFLGQQAMGFSPGQAILPHALGPRKPWRRGYFVNTLRGVPPRTVDKEFWRAAKGPIRALSSLDITRQRALLALASLLGRFYARR